MACRPDILIDCLPAFFTDADLLSFSLNRRAGIGRRRVGGVPLNFYVLIADPGRFTAFRANQHEVRGANGRRKFDTLTLFPLFARPHMLDRKVQAFDADPVLARKNL